MFACPGKPLFMVLSSPQAITGDPVCGSLAVGGRLLVAE